MPPALVVLVMSMAALPHAQTPPADAVEDIDALVARLDWSATARLQKLGAPAVAALLSALRGDTFRSEHGNHSPIMEALEKIGPPAAVALDVALSPAVLEARREAHDAWQRWWQENGATFVVNVRAARIDLECCRI